MKSSYWMLKPVKTIATLIIIFFREEIIVFSWIVHVRSIRLLEFGAVYSRVQLNSVYVAKPHNIPKLDTIFKYRKSVVAAVCCSQGHREVFIVVIDHWGHVYNPCSPYLLKIKQPVFTVQKLLPSYSSSESRLSLFLWVLYHGCIILNNHLYTFCKCINICTPSSEAVFYMHDVYSSTLRVILRDSKIQ